MRRTSLFVASLAILLLGWACSGSELKEPVEHPDGGSTMNLEKPPEGWTSERERKRFPDKVVVDSPKPYAAVENDASDWCVVEVDERGRVSLSLSGEDVRKRAISQIEAQYQLSLSDEGKAYFASISEIGVPINQVQAWLNQDTDEERTAYAEQNFGFEAIVEKGKPNDLDIWVRAIRYGDRKQKFAIRGSADTPYSDIDGVIKVLQMAEVKRFNLITDVQPAEDQE